jgi:hypothetical protein
MDSKEITSMDSKRRMPACLPVCVCLCLCVEEIQVGAIRMHTGPRQTTNNEERLRKEIITHAVYRHQHLPDPREQDPSCRPSSMVYCLPMYVSVRACCANLNPFHTHTHTHTQCGLSDVGAENF